MPRFSAGRARVRLGVNTAIHDDTAAELESFARPLWGLAPLAAGGHAVPHAELWARGLAHGSDPAHPEYWGEPADHDQRIVEMAAIGFALALAPEQWWDPLSGPERDRLARWLLSALHREVPDNNWHFFPVLVGLGLDRIGVSYDHSLATARLDRLETFGSATAGTRTAPPNGATTTCPGRCTTTDCCTTPSTGGDPFPGTGRRFALDFRHWFADDGAAVPYGRSLTYRFAQAAFWGALPSPAWTRCRSGEVKGLLMRHLRWWRDRPATAPGGLLSIGYGYPQPALAEQYNGARLAVLGDEGLPAARAARRHAFWTARRSRPSCPPSARSRPPGRS